MTTVAHTVGLEVLGPADSPGVLSARGGTIGANRRPPLRTEGRQEGNRTGCRPPRALAKLPGWLWEVCNHPEVTSMCGKLYWYWEGELWTENMPSPTKFIC